MGPHKVGGAQLRGLWCVTISQCQYHSSLIALNLTRRTPKSLIVRHFFNRSKPTFEICPTLKTQISHLFIFVHQNPIHCNHSTKRLGLAILHLKSNLLFFLVFASFPTILPKKIIKDNMLLWVCVWQSIIAHNRDKSFLIKWSLFHLCQQSHID